MAKSKKGLAANVKRTPVKPLFERGRGVSDRIESRKERARKTRLKKKSVWRSQGATHRQMLTGAHGPGKALPKVSVAPSHHHDAPWMTGRPTPPSPFPNSDPFRY